MPFEFNYILFQYFAAILLDLTNAKFKFFLACNAAVARKLVVLIPVIVAAVTVGALGIVFVPAEITDKNTGFPKGTVRIDD
ncbi:MAG TPA: hypothetical protein VE692_02465, partial [Nitrososphaera sp.]|nr:hypothetical protein [Nitrososphaera sp.]